MKTTKPSIRRLLSLLLLLVALSSCERVSNLEQTNKELAAKIDSAQKEVDSLKEKVRNLESDHELEKVLKDLDSVAFLTPGSDGYTVVKTDLGALTVSLENIVPYANGSQITLRFGNP